MRLVERMWDALSKQDFSVLEDALADDCIQEWPQSGERVTGRGNILAINQNYPGMPAATVSRTLGSDDLVVSEVELDYRGALYHAVSIFEFEGGKIVRERDYFAEPFDAPGWRAQWVERM